MSLGDNLKVGDKIVDFGTVYRIFQLKKRKDGGSKKRIFFRRYYKNGKAAISEFSLPIENVDMTNIRMPLSKKDVDQLMKQIRKSYRFTKRIDTNNAKDLLKVNDPGEVIRILKNVYAESKKSGENLTKSRRDLLESAFEKLEEEFALALKITVKGARKKIISALDRSISS